MAPNPVLTGSPGRKLRGVADGGRGLAPDIQKYAKIFRGPARLGRVLARFFRNGKSPERPPEYYLGVRGTLARARNAEERGASSTLFPGPPRLDGGYCGPDLSLDVAVVIPFAIAAEPKIPMYHFAPMTISDSTQHLMQTRE